MEQQHPLRLWLDAPGRSSAKLAAELARRGRHVDPGYLETIANGYYPPGRKLSLAIAAATKIPLAELIGFNYRAPRAA